MRAFLIPVALLLTAFASPAHAEKQVACGSFARYTAREARVEPGPVKSCGEVYADRMRKDELTQITGVHGFQRFYSIYCKGGVSKQTTYDELHRVTSLEGAPQIDGDKIIPDDIYIPTRHWAALSPDAAKKLNDAYIEIFGTADPEGRLLEIKKSGQREQFMKEYVSNMRKYRTQYWEIVSQDQLTAGCEALYRRVLCNEEAAKKQQGGQLKDLEKIAQKVNEAGDGVTTPSAAASPAADENCAVNFSGKLEEVLKKIGSVKSIPEASDAKVVQGRPANSGKGDATPVVPGSSPSTEKNVRPVGP